MCLATLRDFQTPFNQPSPTQMFPLAHKKLSPAAYVKRQRLCLNKTEFHAF